MSSKKSTGLGKGFDSLLPVQFDSSILTGEHERIKKIPIGDLQPNPNQPRKHFDEAALAGLATSIKRHGILQPLVVTPADGEKYYIIAGERRWRAARLAGLQNVPAVVRTSKELEQLELALIENVQRVDLSPLEQGASVIRLREQFNLDDDEIAKRLGKAKSTIGNLARLLQLSAEAQEALTKGVITEGHARAILALKTPEQQKELLGLIIKNSWNVRQAERYVTALKAGVKKPKNIQARVRTSTPETEKLGAILKTKVTLSRTAKGGKLEIGFKNETDLKRIIRRIGR